MSPRPPFSPRFLGRLLFVQLGRPSVHPPSLAAISFVLAHRIRTCVHDRAGLTIREKCSPNTKSIYPNTYHMSDKPSPPPRQRLSDTHTHTTTSPSSRSPPLVSRRVARLWGSEGKRGNQWDPSPVFSAAYGLLLFSCASCFSAGKSARAHTHTHTPSRPHTPLTHWAPHFRTEPEEEARDSGWAARGREIKEKVAETKYRIAERSDARTAAACCQGKAENVRSGRGKVGAVWCPVSGAVFFLPTRSPPASRFSVVPSGWASSMPCSPRGDEKTRRSKVGREDENQSGNQEIAFVTDKKVFERCFLPFGPIAGEKYFPFSHISPYISPKMNTKKHKEKNMSIHPRTTK